jgi:hypothetical protein
MRKKIGGIWCLLIVLAGIFPGYSYGVVGIGIPSLPIDDATPSTSFDLEPVILGYLDGLSCERNVNGLVWGCFIWGWTFDAQKSSTPVVVSIFVDDMPIARIYPHAVRDDVNTAFSIAGAHGFDFFIPTVFLNGKSHLLRVVFFAEGKEEYALELTGSPLRFAKKAERITYAPFGFGFLGGDFSANEAWAFSTWNDIHYTCHFQNAEQLASAINDIDISNTVIVELTAAWQNHMPTCDRKGPWGDVALFKDRVAPLLAVLNQHKERLEALWLFDEPDIVGGPSDDALYEAVAFLHQEVPGIPVFINWFDAKKNTRIGNVDWHSTTKGGKVKALAHLGKPMFLWWFNNDKNPSDRTIEARWEAIVAYYLTDNNPPIVSLGWCCGAPPASVAIRGKELRKGILY